MSILGDANFSLNDVWPQRSSKIIDDHFYANIILAHSFMDQFSFFSENPKFFIKLHWPKMSPLCYVFCFFFILRPSDLITTLTYVRIDNFCPCLIYILDSNLIWWIQLIHTYWRLRVYHSCGVNFILKCI